MGTVRRPRTRRHVRMSDAEVWAHPEAERVLAFLKQQDYGDWNRVARAMTRDQWTEGVRQVLEGARCACRGDDVA